MNRLRAFMLLATCAAVSACPPAQTTKKPTATPAETKEIQAAAAYAKQCKGFLDKARSLRDAIVADSPQRSDLNTLDMFNEITIQFVSSGWHASMFANNHPSKQMREAAEKCEQDANNLSTEFSLDRGLYDTLAKVDVSKLDPLAQRFVKHELRDFRRSGVDKDEATRTRIKELKDKLKTTGQVFDKNIRDDVRFVYVDSAADLAGLPKDYVDGHKPDETGKIKITTAYPDLFPVISYAENETLRKDLYAQYRNKGYPANIAVLDQILAIRYELAQLLGYGNWADYATEDMMVGSAKNAEDFINKVSKIAEGRAAREVKLLLDEKRKVHKGAKVVFDWEKSFFKTRVKKEKFAFDTQSVRPYFEYNAVKAGLMDLTKEMYGIDYKPVKNASVWHPSVEVYDVTDNGQTLGRIYLDMHPRKDKYGHAAQWTTRVGVKGKQHPEGVLICNFPNPADGPALMEHSQVQTMFHEFGHLLHNVLGGQQKWARFSGIATERDFAEAPSQFFEEWTRDPRVLSRFAKHHETGAAIPASLVAKMRRANEFGEGYGTRHQMFYAAVSLAYYNRNPEGLDTTKTLMQLQKKYANFPYMPDTHFQAGFGHLDNYTSNYYTYMWSVVISKDLLTPFKKDGMLNTEVSMRYREKVLGPGGTQDAADLVEDFLGRKYSFDAFQAWLENSNM